MITNFIIEKFSDKKDAQGFSIGANVAVKFDMNLKGFLYLPPHLRQNQCNIMVGSEVFGIMDDVTGIGCAMFGIDCDITFKNLADYEFTKTLTVDGAVTMKDKLDVTNDIKSITGDVVATTISLKTHSHPATLTANVTGSVVAGVVEASGPATGSTESPT